MVKRNFIIVSLIVVIATAGWIYFRQRAGAHKFDLGPYHALGVGAAEESAKLLAGKAPVLAIAPDTSETANAAVEAQVAGFQQTIKKAGLTTTIARFRVSPQDRMGSGGAVPAEQLLKALKAQQSVGVIVLFCAFPHLAPAQLTALKQSNAKVVAVSGYLPTYRQLLTSGVLDLAIVPRFGAETPANAKSPSTPRERFESEFQVIKRDNIASLPY